MGTPTTGNPSSIVELEATELLLSQTIQDSQGECVRAIPDMSNEAKNSLKGAHHRSHISCNRPRSTPRRAEVSSADGDRSLSSPLACYDRCGRGGATLRLAPLLLCRMRLAAPSSRVPFREAFGICIVC